jgi:NAD(P)H-hydrate epimerase
MPLPVIDLTQMRQWEKDTWASGQTESEVIRRVGLAIARTALRLTAPYDLILILAGKGHNGDDAKAGKEHLVDRRVDILEVKDPAADLPKLEALLSLRPALIIDGLFGIGLNRPLNEPWLALIGRINQAGLKVLAVDTPSGLDISTGEPQGEAVEAFVTLTVGAPKTGLLSSSAWKYVGRLEVAENVGLAPKSFPSDIQWSLGTDFADFPPRRTVAGHKGTYGHLAVISGSSGYHGAAVLVARGAQRAQPGLITLYTLEAVYQVIASQLQAVMVSPWRSTTEVVKTATALVIGPGLAANDVPEGVKTFTSEAWLSFAGPVVVDASALSWLPPSKSPPRGPRVITPHPGEAARLLQTDAKGIQANRIGALRELSTRFGNTWVVLKGHQTLIGGGKGAVWVNSSGNPHLAQGGAGDLLSGYLGGLLAQPALQADPFKSIAYGVWQHGAAADLLQRERSNWVVEDLASRLGEAKATEL